MTAAKRVAVVGGAGFIGSHVVELLVERGITVLVIDDMSHPCGVSAPAGVETVEADAGSDAAARALAGFHPDSLIHLAGKGGVNKALRDPGDHVGRVLAHSVACFESAARAGCRRILIASSGGAVYGEAKRLPAAESLRPAPQSAYGAEKLCEETYLWTYAKRGLRTVALRYGNVYGPRQDGTGEAGVVAISAWRLFDGNSPVIYGDGGQSRDFVYVRDVATATVAALGCGRNAPINVGTGVETTVTEVVTTLRDIAAPSIPITFGEARGGEVRRACLDTSRARQLLGWQATTSLVDGLTETAAHFGSRTTRAAIAT